MDEKILAELSLDEYIYLTENLEVIEHGGDKNAAAYILARKNSVIKEDSRACSPKRADTRGTGFPSGEAYFGT